MNNASSASAAVDDKEKKSRNKQIQDFLSKAFWLCENSPGICRRSQVAAWLVYCLRKKNDSKEDIQSKQAKYEAVEAVLDFFELRQRKFFEKKLIDFIKGFSQHAPMRGRKISPYIENGTDWGRTYQKALVESPGRLCFFVNYSRKNEFDYMTRNSLLLLAYNMGCELENFAEQLDGIATAKIVEDFRRRAKELMALCKDSERLPLHYYSDRTDYALRRTREGCTIADGIARWLFNPEWDFKLNFQKQEQGAQHPEQKAEEDEFETAAQLLTEKLVNSERINVNDLFEVVATVTSIQTFTECMGFKIVGSDIDNGKPTVTLYDAVGKIYCRVQKNFDKNDDYANDQLKHFRTVRNNPRGLQPDIVYKFWSEEDPQKRQLFLIGDAKNYSREQNAKKINYPIALYAMMHYLIAFRQTLGLSDVLSCLDGEKEEPYQRIVLFFPEGSLDDAYDDCSGEALPGGDKQKDQNDLYPQPGEKDKWHPILFVYGAKVVANSPLKKFFEDAIKQLRGNAVG